MGLQFNCPHCNEPVVVRFLAPGEECLCRACGEYCLVPESAQATEEFPERCKIQVRKSTQRKSLPPDPNLADPWIRLGARLIDGTIAVLVWVAVFIAALSWKDLWDQETLVQIGFGMFGLFLVFEIVLLSVHGQTIGKKLLNIRITRYPDDRKTGFVRNVLLREVVNGIISIIPFYGLIDALFIFSEDRRCLHDHIAGTKVVRVHKDDWTVDGRLSAGDPGKTRGLSEA